MLNARTPINPEELQRRLAAIVGSEFVRARASERFAYSRDCYPKTILWTRQGKIPYPPEAVVWPKDELEVAAVVKELAGLGVPLIPYGAGSGVAGGTLPVKGGVVLDLKRLEDIYNLDTENCTAEIGAGAVGQILEDDLNKRGFTLGHFPSSIYCSSLGGWLATRSAGQMSTRYGKIEDMVLGLRGVDGRGEIFHFVPKPRSAGGFNFLPLILGNEGVTFIITAATMRIRPLPAECRMRAFSVKNVEEGAEAIRLILQAGIFPAVVRLYDQFDSIAASRKLTPDRDKKHAKKERLGEIAKKAGAFLSKNPALRHFAAFSALNRPYFINQLVSNLPLPCTLILGFEGEAELCELDERETAKLLSKLGAKDLGAGPGEHWYQNRYAVSYKQSPIFALGAVVDTMEVAATWAELMPLYREVKEAVAAEAFIMAHFSHAYPEGCSIYFTFAAMAESEEELELRYDRIWTLAMSAVRRMGATVSHHHGVGFSKQAYMEREIGPLKPALLALKRFSDPAGILNPRKLGL
jgi:alkyldihydroxyacetonephosphate synthase